LLTQGDELGSLGVDRLGVVGLGLGELHADMRQRLVTVRHRLFEAYLLPDDLEPGLELLEGDLTRRNAWPA
jgi:hypothetical protein